jgi:hypothetical protein
MTTEPRASVGDVAKHLGVAKDSAYRWLESRRFPDQETGRLWSIFGDAKTAAMKVLGG